MNTILYTHVESYIFHYLYCLLRYIPWRLMGHPVVLEQDAFVGFCMSFFLFLHWWCSCLLTTICCATHSQSQPSIARATHWHWGFVYGSQFFFDCCFELAIHLAGTCVFAIHRTSLSWIQSRPYSEILKWSMINCELSAFDRYKTWKVTISSKKRNLLLAYVIDSSQQKIMLMTGLVSTLLIQYLRWVHWQSHAVDAFNYLKSVFNYR